MQPVQALRTSLLSKVNTRTVGMYLQNNTFGQQVAQTHSKTVLFDPVRNKVVMEATLFVQGKIVGDFV